MSKKLGIGLAFVLLFFVCCPNTIAQQLRPETLAESADAESATGDQNSDTVFECWPRLFPLRRSVVCRSRNVIVADCRRYVPAITGAHCSPQPTLAPALPRIQPTNWPEPINAPCPVCIPATYPIRLPYARPVGGLRLGGSLEREWTTSRTPVGWLVK